MIVFEFGPQQDSTTLQLSIEDTVNEQWSEIAIQWSLSERWYNNNS